MKGIYFYKNVYFGENIKRKIIIFADVDKGGRSDEFNYFKVNI